MTVNLKKNSLEKGESTTKARFIDFFYVGSKSNIFSEDFRRVFIINFFATIGVLFSFPLGVFSFFEGDFIRGCGLIAISLIYAGNHFYLRCTHNYTLSGCVVIYPLYTLMVYLMYTGGFQGTGHVWIYCIPAVSLFLNGLKRGLIELSIFFLALIVVMFFMDSDFSKFSYHEVLKSRILLLFHCLLFMNIPCLSLIKS